MTIFQDPRPLGNAGDPRSFDPHSSHYLGDGHSRMTVEPLRQPAQAEPPGPPPTLTSEIYADTGQVASEWNQHYAAVRADPDLNEEARARKLNEFDASRLERNEKLADERVALAEQRIRETLRSNLPDSSSEAAQTYATRVWNRDNISNVPVGEITATATELFKNGTDQEVAVYMEEMPKAINKLGLPGDEIVEQLARNRYPDLAEDYEVRRLASNAALFAKQNANVVRRGIKGRHAVDPQFLCDPGWKHDPDRRNG